MACPRLTLWRGVPCGSPFFFQALPPFSHRFLSLPSRNEKSPLPFLAFAIIRVRICNPRDNASVPVARDFSENFLDNL
jgi:hypothetical protein